MKRSWTLRLDGNVYFSNRMEKLDDVSRTLMWMQPFRRLLPEMVMNDEDVRDLLLHGVLFEGVHSRY